MKLFKRKILLTGITDSGILRVRSELINWMISEGAEVIVASPKQTAYIQLRKMGCKFIELPIDAHGINPINDIKLYKRYITLLKTEKPDIVLTFTTKPNIYATYACKKLNIKYITNITGRGRALVTPGWKQKLMILMLKSSLSKAACVFFQNDGDMQFFMAEEFLTKWCTENNIVLGILRPSLLAGKNAPGNLGAMVNGIKKGFYMNIDAGKVRKSVLMAEDIARLIPMLVDKGGIFNVCDTNQPSFGEISASVAKQLGKRKPMSIPYCIAWCMAKVGDLLGSNAPINSYKLSKITESLTFSNDKARRELGWEPLDVLENYRI